MPEFEVVPHNADWCRKYEVETARLRAALGGVVAECHHIGSTAVPGDAGLLRFYRDTVSDTVWGIMNRTDVCAAIESIMETHGVCAVESGEFGGAYVMRGRLANLVFLVVDLGENRVEPENIESLVKRARQWCKDDVQAMWGILESGLNLVLLHDGQVAKGQIKGLPDSTGMHAAILQSVTTVDCRGGSVAQAKTWLIIGTARKVIRKLAKLGI